MVEPTTGDFERTIYRLASLYDLPPYVKEASAEQVQANPRATGYRYADAKNHALPVHSQAATWLSAAEHFDRTAVKAANSKDDSISETLLDAADYWGIRSDVDTLLKKIAANNNVVDDKDLPDDAFAVVDNGQRRLRLANPHEIKCAAEWLTHYRDEFYYPDRQKIARRIVSRAEATSTTFEPELNQAVNRIAGYGTCTQKQATAFLRDRASYFQRRHSKVAAELRDLADGIDGGQVPAIDNETLTKVATVIDYYDRTTGVQARYSDELRRPEDALFEITEKTAAEFLFQKIATPVGDVYDRDTLARLPLATVRDHLGSAFAEAVSDSTGFFVDGEKFAEILPTMPADDAAAFGRLVKAEGLRGVKLAAARPKAWPDLVNVVEVLR